MLEYAIICEFSDLTTGVEETSTLGWAAYDDLEEEIELHAMSAAAYYNIMPRKRGMHRWEIREPGELLIVIKSEKVRT